MSSDVEMPDADAQAAQEEQEQATAEEVTDEEDEESSPESESEDEGSPFETQFTEYVIAFWVFWWILMFYEGTG
jgi:hypothetical protein